jgi:tripartite-type tricarboxylate transporter receptor subunit TctC
MLMKWNRVAAIAATAMFISAGAAAEETFPSRVVKIYVGFPAGSSADILGRVYAQKLSQHFGKQFIIENRAGASSNIAAELVTKANPDGYTIVIGSVANTISANTLTVGYDFGRDLDPIATFANAPVVLMVSATLGISNVKDFVAYAKEHSGKVSFGSSGTWSGPHLAGELFSQATGANLSFVPYQGVPQSITDLLGGQIPVVFATAPTAASFFGDDRVKLLAVTSDKRSDLIPNVPTMQEEGLKGVDTSIWYGFFAPKGTPLAIRKILADAILQINDMPDVKEILEKNGAEPYSISLDSLGAFVENDLRKWKTVTDRVKAKMN